MLKDLSVGQFVREVASDSPAPGGGSVAALAGAQAASLISMYCSLSLNPKKYGEAVAVLEKTGNEARLLSENLIEAVDLDTAAFNRVLEAFRLPKGTETEKKQRIQAVQETTIEAARVPLRTAEDCLRLLELVETAAGKGNPGAVTDLGVGNLQALAGLTGACYNVQINLGSISDPALKAQFSGEVSAIQTRGWELFEINRAIIEKNI